MFIKLSLMKRENNMTLSKVSLDFDFLAEYIVVYVSLNVKYVPYLRVAWMGIGALCSLDVFPRGGRQTQNSNYCAQEKQTSLTKQPFF
jgi:hypothetical protein